MLLMPSLPDELSFPSSLLDYGGRTLLYAGLIPHREAALRRLETKVLALEQERAQAHVQLCALADENRRLRAAMAMGQADPPWALLVPGLEARLAEVEAVLEQATARADAQTRRWVGLIVLFLGSVLGLPVFMLRPRR